MHQPDGRRIGPLLRAWRHRRRISQLDLAIAAGSSARHLSFLETGRARPSRSMVLRLAEHLDVPLRERNELLLAAGYAPHYRETGIDAEQMRPVRTALDALLEGHEPFPAVLVDRTWNLLAANRAAAVLTEGVAPSLLQPQANVYRLALHPAGLAPRLLNFAEVRSHLLDRLHRQVTLTGDELLRALHEEVRGYPGPPDAGDEHRERPQIFVPVRLRSEVGELAFFSTITTFGAPADVTLSELAVESFFAADEATASALRALARSRA
jgi:transcriptional regulator with XRE-family HTH domain